MKWSATWRNLVRRCWLTSSIDWRQGPVDDERQDFMIASYAPRLTKEEGLVDWTLPAAFIHNRVRGLYPWPHAYTYLDGHRG